ncbi:hypothetical protein AVEN_70503-1 [Araneus ventricosus]|uniref:Uncharacterized protein n=1 Tax=Araneus ventricosus TaxID=182803 RepID=A0A4Y2UFU3_ARAVE|nr:hypothetical protein AVEN_70503-1 [Araneus ventricosus]
MFCDGVILLHDNTHTRSQNSRIAVKVQVGSLEPPIYRPNSALNLGSKDLSGTRFSSESDVKRIFENWLHGQDVISTKPG